MSSDSELEDSTSESGLLDEVGYGPLCAPGEMVSVKVKGGHTFCIHRHVLTEQSDYFARAVDGLFSDSIDLDDISVEDFGLYVSVMYPLALHRADMRLQDVWSLDACRDPHYPWPQILLLWQLGDRFLNEFVKDIAEVEIHAKGRGFSVSHWQRMYERKSEASLKAKMLELQDAFRLCLENGQPFERSFVTAASNAPPQVFAACVDDLQDDLFRSEVTKAFALRFADPASTAQKRRREETKNEHREKRLKIEK